MRAPVQLNGANLRIRPRGGATLAGAILNSDFVTISAIIRPAFRVRAFALRRLLDLSVSLNGTIAIMKSVPGTVANYDINKWKYNSWPPLKPITS